MRTQLYDRIGTGYGRFRRPDPRIASRIHRALGGARSVVNVGAGAGSYEPADRPVVAVEPSATMVAQRPAGAAPAVRAVASALPFRDASFDAALAVLTLHHWPDWRAGVAELARVARERVVVLTCDPDAEGFWLVRDYFPGIVEQDRRVFPPPDDLARALGGADVVPVPVPWDCADGFLGAYWRRPEAYLNAGVRGAISAFARLPDAEEGLARLRGDLADGAWARRNADVLTRGELDVGYRLVVAGM
ncbi:MAG TPA: class I SAM-dependent methyltransferase [Longimicrobiaceae bacterium]